MKKIYFASFCLFCLIPYISAVSAYNDTLTRYWFWPLSAAANNPTPEKCVSNILQNSQFQRRYSVPCDMNKGDDCTGFTAISHSDKAIIISFRGSTLPEVVQEVADALEDAPISPFVGGGNVLKYFLDGFNDIWTAGMKDDFYTMKNANPGYELWITGHSLGAAMASLTATTIAHLKLFQIDKIKLVTFGQPRVGDKDYAAVVDSLLPYSYRVIHNRDMFAHVPPQWLKGYHHHQSEIWYPNDMKVGDSWIECDVDEGPGCSDGHTDLNIPDHLIYFQHLTESAAFDDCKGWNPYKH
uniref:Fungal lipase-like domain-containing protein n=1 Tax=Panagrolaimus davidi TaxID=227884 RepID=A0A914PIE5_9BILA